MAARRVTTRHFSIPAEPPSQSDYRERQETWTSDIRHDRRRRRSTSQQKRVGIEATASEHGLASRHRRHDIGTGSGVTTEERVGQRSLPAWWTALADVWNHPV